MNIAIDARGANLYAGTGIGTYTIELLKYINLHDFENNYLLYWYGSNYKQFNFNKNISISIASKKHHHFFEEYFIPENLKAKKIDLYHVPQNGIGLPSKKSCIYISTIHDLIPYVMPETVGRGYLKKFISQMPQIIQNSDFIITVSNFSKKDIMRIFDVEEDKIKVTHLAADDYFRPIEKDVCRNFLNKRYNIDFDYFLYIGGFSPRKNVKSILLAYSRLIKDIRDRFKVVIVGSSKDEHSFLISLANSLNIKENVVFTGYVPYEDLPYFYSGATLFLYPSLYEGFGLPPLEAMSCQTPVITSNVSSIPEIVEDAALLINPFDAEELKNSIEILIEDDNKRNSLAKKGYEHSLKFSWNKTAKETLNIYKEAVEKTF
ncbi:MAG: glycosyl transferase [Caloramator sp.]|nr:MAG: glycosyl transferase [Caloramator sp.]